MDNVFSVDYSKTQVFWEGQQSKAGYFQLLQNVNVANELPCNAVIRMKFIGKTKAKIVWMLWLEVLERLSSAKTPESIIQFHIRTLTAPGSP